jgi:hypothetical protein
MTVDLSGAFPAPDEEEFRVLVDHHACTYELRPQRWSPDSQVMQLKVDAPAFYARVYDHDNRLVLAGLLGSSEGGGWCVTGVAGIHMGSIVAETVFNLADLLEDARARLGVDDDDIDGSAVWGTFRTRLNFAAFLAAGIGALHPGSKVVFDTKGGTRADYQRCSDLLSTCDVYGSSAIPFGPNML